MWRLSLGILILYGIAFVLLWVGNLPRFRRHKQIWSPVLAFVVVAACVVLAYFLPSPSGTAWQQAIRQTFQRVTGIPGAPFPVLLLVINGVGLVVFAGVKMLVNGGIRLLSWFFSSSPSAARRIAYQDHEDEVVLKPAWFFPGLLARTTALVALVVLLICIVGQTVFDPLGLLAEAISLPPFQYPTLPGLPAFLLLEIGWYLNGRRASELDDYPPGIDPVESEIKGTYDKLWNEYQELWPEKVLAASRQPLLWQSRPGQTVIDFEDEDPELRTVWSDLLRHPAVQPLDEDDFEVLSRLWNGDDLLVEDPTYDRIAPVLATSLYYDLLDGEQTLILVDPRRSAQLQSDPTTASIQWMSEWISTLHGVGDTLRITSLDAFRRRRRDRMPDILVTSAEELSNLNVLGSGRDADIEWFSGVKKIVVLDGASTIFRHTQSTSSFLYTLTDTVQAHNNGRSPQLVVLSENRRNLQPSLRQILPAEPFEKRLPFPRPQNAYVLCWRTEDPPFQNALFEFAGFRIGDEPVLALPAWREDLRSISLVEQQDLPCVEFLEELDAHKEQLHGTVVPPSSLHGRTSRRLTCHQNVPWLIPQQDRSLVIVRDRHWNLVRALRRWMSIGREHAFVHVVSPPYLLRDYFASNVDFFLQVDAPVVLQSPRFADKTESFVAHQLLRRLMSEWMDEQSVRHELETIGRGDQPVDDALQELFRSVFGIDVLGNSLLQWNEEHRYRPSADRFVSVTSFHLRRSQLLTRSSLEWMASISVVDDAGRVLDTIPREHLFQTFLSGQLHAFNGRPYRIQEADLENKELRVTHDEEWDGRVGYRPDLKVTLDGANSSSRRHIDTRDGWNVVRDLRTPAVRIETIGYFRLEAQDGSLIPFPQDFDASIPPRVYEEAQVAHLSFRPTNEDFKPPTDISKDDFASISWTLAVLLREVLPTVFPDTSPLVLVLPPESGSSPLPHVLPSVRFHTSPEASPAVELYVLEDSRSELGLAKRILYQWTDLLSILDDYVHWLTERNGSDDAQMSDEWNVDLEPETFLKYGGEDVGEIDAARDLLDFEATKMFLKSFFDDDESCLRNRRREFYRRGTPHPLPETGQQCDFCRRPVSTTEYEQINDGRIRCRICSEQATDTVEELEQAYEDARSFLEDTLGVDIAHDVEVRLTDTQIVQEAAGKDFVPTSSFDPRVLGIAIRNQDGLSILVENGQPYYMAKGVIAHELTHIWQFEKLNYRRLKAEEGKVIIEGHAQWTELASIQDMPEAQDYIERQKSRVDVYGEGYRRITETLKEEGNFDTPFEWLLHQYGR